MTLRAVAVVGASQAASYAVRTLRQEGFEGRIALIGEEPYLPYERPPLSKELLRGESDLDSAFVLSAQWYEDNEIELRLGQRAERIDRRERSVELEDGTRVRADVGLLTTGGRPLRLPGAPPGERVVELRTVADAERLRPLLAPGRRLIIVGAGYIGMEVAASARTRDAEATVIEALREPLAHTLGKEAGEACAWLHRERGVDLRTGTKVVGIEETNGGVRVTTDASETIEGDAVLVGVGIRPNVEVAEASGITTDDGVVVDEHCRTNLEGVFAAGDVARHFHPLFGYHVRVEHYENANKQGVAAALSLIGRDEAYRNPHWVWSDQYEHRLLYAGHVHADRCDTVVRGDPGCFDFTAFYTVDGILRAAFSFNRHRDVMAAQRLILVGAAPPPQLLQDEDTDLRRVVKQFVR